MGGVRLGTAPAGVPRLLEDGARPGSYPKPPYGYGEAVRRGYGYVLDLKFMRTFVETGKPDPEYLLNCYPAKMDIGLINGMICCAKVVPERREDALRLARAAAVVARVVNPKLL